MTTINDESEFAVVKLVLDNEEDVDGLEHSMFITPYDREHIPGHHSQQQLPLLTLSRLIHTILIHNPKWILRIVRDTIKGDQQNTAWISIGDGYDLLVLIDDAIGTIPLRTNGVPVIRMEGILTNDDDDDDEENDFIMEPFEHVFPFLRSERIHNGVVQSSVLLLRAKNLSSYCRSFQYEHDRTMKPTGSYLSSVVLLRTDKQSPLVLAEQGMTAYRQLVADAWREWTENRTWLLLESENNKTESAERETSNDAAQADLAVEDMKDDDQKEAASANDATPNDVDIDAPAAAVGALTVNDTGKEASDAESKDTVKRANGVGHHPEPSTSKEAENEATDEQGQEKDKINEGDEENGKDDTHQPQMEVIPESVPDHLELETNLTSKQILLLEKGYHDTITKSDWKLQGKRSSKTEKVESHALVENLTKSVSIPRSKAATKSAADNKRSAK